MFSSLSMIQLFMIINNFNIRRMSVLPFKYNTPLIVNPDTIIILSVSGELFQPVGWRDPQIWYRNGVVQHPEFPSPGLLNFKRKFCRSSASPDFFSFFRTKGLDHTTELRY